MRKELELIKEYIAGQGYSCAQGLVENYYLSLRCRPFLVLTGTSHTDMTKLPQLFAEAVGATRENGRYQCLKVEYDWMDTSDLFGHLDLWGKFIPGAVFHFLKQAREDPEHPYFLCLDGLILSRAEYYLREILNIIAAAEEGRTPDDLVPMIYYGSDTEAAQTHGRIPALSNLYIIGTLNLDETSFPLNQKFIDRVHTLQIDPEDMVDTGEKSTVQPQSLPNAFLSSDIRRLDQCGDYPEKRMDYIRVFEELNKLLMQANAYVGYQIRNDAVVYLINNHQTGVLEETQAIDHVITQKVLVRAQGNEKVVKPVLEQLQQYCAGRYPKAEKKLAFMLSQCARESYTNYWF